MRKGRRSGERLFCWSLWAFVIGIVLTPGLWAAGPALTTISDTVYRADGTAAAGTVLISWPAFQTAEGDVVAAGNQSVAIGTGGSFTTQLVPNAGASPTGTYYTVVFQLDDYSVRTEYWSVPATSPTTITAVRTTPGVGLANPAATQQYVNEAVANRALDSAVVHLTGAETITGSKQFAAPPVLPAPVGTNDAANKAYVDGSVANVGAGAFVSKAGDTMTGPLTLAGDPTAPEQAATRHYVDSGLAAKANLASGVVPPDELGSGLANASTCLNGNSTWGSCGGGSPAGITYATTAQNWTQTISSTLTGGTQATVTLTPCPTGIDTTSGAGYEVFVSGGGNSEAVNVVGGSCLSGASSGTVVLTPYYSYPAGSTIGSASSGIQETLNAACGVDVTSWKNSQCNVTVPANGPGSPHSINSYSVPGTIYLHSNQSVFSGYGVSLDCTGRGACLQVGNLTGSNAFGNNTVQGFSFRTPTNYSSNPAYLGVAITNTQRASQLVTITTASAHGFRPGDMVTILFTDNNAYWGDARVTVVPSSTSFQYAHTGSDIAAQATPGVVALAYVAVLDSGMNTHFTDISYDRAGENGNFNNFFDLWDDENATIDHFNNNAISMNGNANWTGSFVFSAGNQGSLNQIAPVITLRDSNITANYSNGVTVYNSNGVYIENTVLQATGPWQVYASNSTGNYQGAYLKNIYSESSAGANPVSPARSPFAGTGVAGLIAGPTSAAGNFAVVGTGGVGGAFPSGGSGTTPYSYFIVAHDGASQTSPMQVSNYSSTGSDSITVRWPRVANGTDTITYDVIRTTTPVGVGAVYPSYGNCNGGTTTSCGYVAHNLAQCAGLVCTYTDSGSAVPQSYTVAQGTYGGNLIFWPGSIVSVNKSVTVDLEHGNVVGVGLTSSPLQVARRCSGYGQTSPGGYTSCTASVTTPNNSVPNQTATLLTDGAAGGGGQTVSKGRLNFATSPWAILQPHHIITLVDSQPGLTEGTIGYRPPASANDVWIGTDVPAGGVGLNAGQLALGAPVAITNYIGATGDGAHTNWLERLSASLKEFNVGVKFDQSVTMSGGVILPQGSGYVPANGGIGLDTAAGVPVVNVGGATHQVAFTSSNISGQAGTALALAATPTQCSGSFATGIAANGNANCTTPNVIQLAETTAPIDPPNWGVFWFDSATHTPRVIENNGQVVQLGLTNFFNSDPGGDAANNLEQRNGATPQNLRVYSSYTNSTNWARTSLGFDAADSYAVLKSENANSGAAAGLGLWVGSAKRWVIDGAYNFKPWADNLYNLGSDTANAPKSVFAKTSFNTVVKGRHDFEIPNDTTNGTVANKLAVYNTNNPSQAVVAGTSSPNVIGLVQDGAGTTGNAVIAWSGYGNCIFDNATVAGHAVVASTTVAGDCHDSGSAAQPSVQLIGYVDVTNTVSGQTNGMRISLQPAAGSGGGGSINSVFGRTGTIVATAGDYSVSQVTGAAADSAVVHLTGAETIAGTKTFTSDVTLSGNLNVAGIINQTSTGSTQWSGKKWTGTAATVPTGMDYSLGIGSDNTLKCQLASGASCMPAGDAVASVFGRTGAVTAGTGDYTVSQVTGAAPLASPGFTGTPTGPTPSAGDSSTKLATTAFVQGTVPPNSTAVPWLTFSHGGSNINFSTAANKAIFTGVILDFPKTTTQVSYNISTADNTANTYDLGVYSGTSGGTCTLQAHIGSTAGTTFASSTGWKTTNWTGGAVTLQPGRYYLAYTTSCTSSCATLTGDSVGFTFAGSTGGANSNVSVTSGGTLPATATCPADLYATTSTPNWAID
jgi:hypothetical protein